MKYQYVIFQLFAGRVMLYAALVQTWPVIKFAVSQIFEDCRHNLTDRLTSKSNDAGRTSFTYTCNMVLAKHSFTHRIVWVHYPLVLYYEVLILTNVHFDTVHCENTPAVLPGFFWDILTVFQSITPWKQNYGGNRYYVNVCCNFYCYHILLLLS